MDAMQYGWYFQDIVDTLLWGAVLCLILLAIIRKWKPDIIHNILQRYALPGIQLISILGIIFFLLWVLSEVHIIYVIHIQKDFAYHNQFFHYDGWTLIRSIGPVLLLVVTQSFWWKANRSKVWLFWVLALVFLMANDMFIILFTSLHRDFLVSSWTMYYPSYYGLGLLFSMGSFAALVWVYQKLLPHFNPS